MLRILEEKGHLSHRRDGARYIYVPTISPDEAGKSAMNYMVQAFFNGSADRVVSALLDLKGDELSDTDLDRLAGLIEKAKQQEDN